MKHLPLFGKVSAYVLFWGWNLLLLTVLGFGFGPIVLLEIVIATFKGIVPWTFALVGLVVIVIPSVACVLAALTHLRSHPGRLLSMFYGVQVPVMLLLLVRLFAIHELVAANAFALGVVVLGGASLLRTLFHGPTEKRAPLQLLQLVGASGYLLVGLWWASLAGITIAPYLGHMLAALLEFPMGLLRMPLSEVPFLLYLTPFFLFGLFTFAMFLVMPFATLGISARNWQLVHRAASTRWGLLATVLSLGTTVAVFATFLVVGQQPQRAAIEAIRAVQTDADRIALESELESLRTGLVAARIGGDRYLEGDPDDLGLDEHYAPYIGMTLAQIPETLAGWLVRPLSYDSVDNGRVRIDWRNSLPKDAKTATDLYAEVFDAPMDLAERDVLLRSASYTWSWEDVEAGLLDIGERKVRLAAQQLTVDRAGDLATVLIHDEWRNQTWGQEEIRLSFELPESAAVTGLWLGHTDDRSKAFAYVVAPRGAAQEVYEREVKRRVDPALLEQVGPRQYRLRAFPVDPRTDAMGDVWTFGNEGPPLHMWTEVVVPAADDGTFPLPQLSEARNAFWDERSVRTIDGAPATADSWTPASVTGASAKTHHHAVVSGFEVTATPSAPTLAMRRAVDVIIDSSASMRPQRARIDAALTELSAAMDVRVFCVREQVLAACDRDWKAQAFWGHASPAEQIADWSELDRSPEALVVLTDSGSYSLIGTGSGSLAARANTTSGSGGRDGWRRPSVPQTIEESLPDVEVPPLWLVHFDGFPAAYPDWTLDRIQRSGGGVVGTVDDLLSRMATPNRVDGWTFDVQPAPEGTPNTTGPFTAIAARAAIRSVAGDGTGALAQLDALHALAVEHHVVTAWSSMLVLVNDRQKQALKDATEGDDRFEREATDGNSFSEVSAVPEPSTWLLLALGAGLLLRGRRRD